MLNWQGLAIHLCGQNGLGSVSEIERDRSVKVTVPSLAFSDRLVVECVEDDVACLGLHPHCFQKPAKR